MHSSKTQAPELFGAITLAAPSTIATPTPSPGLAEAARICVRRLNQLREGELAAAAAYDAFLSQQDCEGDLQLRLAHEVASHRGRAARLAELVVEMGGQLQSEPGTWGFFESMAEPMALAASETMALALLEEGERYGVREYHAALHRLVGEPRNVLEAELLPEQLRTFRDVSHLLAELRGLRNVPVS